MHQYKHEEKWLKLVIYQAEGGNLQKHQGWNRFFFKDLLLNLETVS